MTAPATQLDGIHASGKVRLGWTAVLPRNARERRGCADYRRSSATLALRIRSTAAISSPARTLALFDYIVGAHEQRSRRTRWRGYEAAESRNTYSAAIFPSRTMTTSKPV